MNNILAAKFGLPVGRDVHFFAPKHTIGVLVNTIPHRWVETKATCVRFWGTPVALVAYVVLVVGLESSGWDVVSWSKLSTFRSISIGILLCRFFRRCWSWLDTVERLSCIWSLVTLMQLLWGYLGNKLLLFSNKMHLRSLILAWYNLYLWWLSNKRKTLTIQIRVTIRYGAILGIAMSAKAILLYLLLIT